MPKRFFSLVSTSRCPEITLPVFAAAGAVWPQQPGGGDLQGGEYNDLQEHLPQELRWVLRRLLRCLHTAGRL